MLAPVGSLPSAGSPPPSPHSPGFSHNVPGNAGVANNMDTLSLAGPQTKTNDSGDGTKPKKKKKKTNNNKFTYGIGKIKSFAEFKSKKSNKA